MNYKDQIDEAMSNARMMGCVIDFIVAILLMALAYYVYTVLR
jgi:hypothetical protein